jgi:PLP dependent protein
MYMHNTVKNLLDIDNNIKVYLNKLNINNSPKIVAVSKTFKIDKILPLIEHGHIDYGENKVQEAIEKWTEIKKINSQVRLHMIGKLQTNKVKFAVQIFDYIHSVDSEKLAKKIADEQNKINKKIKIFLQVNIGDENQKSGINKNDVSQLVSYCKEIDLDLIGLMCIPPANIDPESYFEEMSKLNKTLDLAELSMGMSSDFLIAAKHFSTYVRVGSSIFGQRF